MSRKKPDTVSGVIVINKHAGITSFGIVAAMRRLFDTSRVGHTGTLDPMATGGSQGIRLLHGTRQALHRDDASRN